MAVGLPLKTTYADGDVYSASDVNDTNGTVNLVGQTLNFYAGKNKIINGDFNIWQRGSSFTPAGAAGVSNYTADRFFTSRDGTGATVTVSRQNFTPGTAPVSGYESQYFYRYAQTVAGTSGTYVSVLGQIVEGLGLSGQTVTYSFWAKADTARTVSVGWAQYFGSGGSSTVYSSATNVNLTTSWARYSVTFAISSITGKTIGTGQVGIEFYIAGANNTTQTYDFWGAQIEVGSTATAFQTSTGTIQGELAACQRYYRKSYDTNTAPGTVTTNGAVTFYSPNTTNYPWIPSSTFGISMRTAPSVTTYNPATGSTSNPVRNFSSSTNHPLYVAQIGENAVSSYVDNSSITSGNVIGYHYVASAEL